jgi:hypothetical protein
MGPPNQSLPTQHLNDEGGPSTQATGPELANTQKCKKRKPNANGSRQSAPCWEFFIRLPDNEVEIPTAVCKLCHKRYLCHPRFHGTSNMNTHILKCPQILALKASRANQTLLSFPTVEGAGLTTVSSRFNQLACRKTLAVFDKSVSMLTFFYAQFVISICNNLVNVQLFNNELLFLLLLIF